MPTVIPTRQPMQLPMQRPRGAHVVQRLSSADPNPIRMNQFYQQQQQQANMQSFMGGFTPQLQTRGMLPHVSPYMQSRDVRQNLPHFAAMNGVQRAGVGAQMVQVATAVAQQPAFHQQQSQPQLAPAPQFAFGVPQFNSAGQQPAQMPGGVGAAPAA